MTTTFADTWSAFCRELDCRSGRLYREFAACWQDCDALLQAQVREFRLENWQQPRTGSLASLEDLVATAGTALLFQPLGTLKRVRPQLRALAAVEVCDSAVDDLSRMLPPRIEVSSRELSAAVPPRSAALLRKIWMSWKGKPRPFMFRSAAREGLLRELTGHTRYQGELLLLLARGSLTLLAPWQLVRQEALRVLLGQGPDLRRLERERQIWLRKVSSLQTKAAEVLPVYEDWTGRSAVRLSASLLRRRDRFSPKREEHRWERWQRYFSYWSHQQRSVASLLELESTAAHLMTRACGSSRESIESLHAEHTRLLKELDDVIGWLTHQQSGGAQSAFPPPEARLLSAEDRTSSLMREIVTDIRASVPTYLDYLVPRRALPGRRPPWRQLAVQNSLLQSLERAGRTRALGGYLEAEGAHRAVVRQIERAREVSAFCIEAAAAGDDESLRVARDGITNALRLVENQKAAATDYRPVIEQHVTEALAASFREFHMALEEGKLGFLAYVAQQRGSQLIRTGTAIALARLRTLTGRGWSLLSRGYYGLLVRVGWSAPPAVAPAPVRRREFLGELLRLQATPRVLPPIYKRLFRLDPVEDARFLVGRDTEMAALAEARRLWKSGRAVSVAVVGARGSGKTSLLKCAVTSVFDGLEVIYGQVRERLTSEEAVVAFLADLVKSDPSGLAEALASRPRVIMLEEVERTFLRKIGGFEGLRALRQWIAQTCRNTLWILSLTEAAFRYLSGVAGLNNQFSHTINAMAVAPEDLQSAILLRHNLSGLRLQFAPPPPPEGRAARMRRFFGMEKEPEQLFFGSLYRKSDGIFRSAFELWQQSIDRVEGGVLYMMDPSEPPYESMITDLTLKDAFTLQAILQHGSLTREELAQVFDLEADASRAQLDRLEAWELIEPDPRSPGYRVRPEAGRLVHIALHRENLD